MNIDNCQKCPVRSFDGARNVTKRIRGFLALKHRKSFNLVDADMTIGYKTKENYITCRLKLRYDNHCDY
ncbi:Hypothetical predicted protein [Octopus vulgaris]|uniref:Uncharacterized protein n=1 Tax=Octopus vulgaris TaxID=6645 RepID=A0AA36BIR5_OCTVU|nr:Hypothetical predicted protein [Octopus vulgaris]